MLPYQGIQFSVASYTCRCRIYPATILITTALAKRIPLSIQRPKK